jgi:hypothetical protein
MSSSAVASAWPSAESKGGPGAAARGRAVQPVDHVVGDPVALLLADHDVPGEIAPVREVGEHLVEQIRPADDVLGGLLEQVEELAVARQEDLRQACHDVIPSGVRRRMGLRRRSERPLLRRAAPV